MTSPSHPFEATAEQLEANIEQYVDGFIGSLQSFFMVMPRGSEFIDFPRFQQAYEALKKATGNFEDLSTELVLNVVRQDPLVLVVLRTMLGFSPPEFAYMASLTAGVEVDQSSARRLDKRAREGKPLLGRTNSKTQQQVETLVRTAVNLIGQGSPIVNEGVIHRLDKVDTKEGLESVRRLARAGVPYEMLLYERLLGRPFSTHRDSVSGQVGDVIEDAVKQNLDLRGISYHKAGMAERFEDMDQAPDFLIPDQFKPAVLIEAKLAEDDGTARDKVTRVQHLAELRDQRLRRGSPSFEVVACVDGRGFGIRREDVKKLLFATKGKLFTLQTVERIMDSTSLKVLKA
ncbi:MAG: hypothetical protein IT330_01525 [Anaerolineae bacterium]|nr:hypothetical protein [Anaerolineae bacterium]